MKSMILMLALLTVGCGRNPDDPALVSKMLEQCKGDKELFIHLSTFNSYVEARCSWK